MYSKIGIRGVKKVNKGFKLNLRICILKSSIVSFSLRTLA